MNEDRRKMREVVEFRRQAPVAGRNNINAQMSHLGQLALAFMEASLDLHGYHLNTIDRPAPATYKTTAGPSSIALFFLIARVPRIYNHTGLANSITLDANIQPHSQFTITVETYPLL